MTKHWSFLIVITNLGEAMTLHVLSLDKSVCV